MNAVIRIVKHGSQGSNDLQPSHDDKTSQQVHREMVSTVKGWIEERTLRKRSEELIYSAFRKLTDSEIAIGAARTETSSWSYFTT
jgi:hypothetical protein